MTRGLCALIPCAGFSKRMGRFKPLLELGQRPIIVQVIETLKSVTPEKILVVVGHRAEELESIVENAGAKILQNRDFAQGMFSSVRTGVKYLDGGCDAFILLPADIPLVRPATLRQLAQISRRQPDRIVYPMFFGQRGHPAIIPSSLIPQILEHTGDGGMRKILANHEDRVLEVPVADENILFDVDRPEDFKEAIRRFNGLDDPSPAECEAVLCEVYPTGQEIVQHGRQVQRTAITICRAMNQAGAELNENRVSAAGLMHDIAKGTPDHARVGAKNLKRLGFDAVAKIVEAHTDLPETELETIGEAGIVYLADKLTAKDRYISLESRFEQAFQRYGQNRDARSAIEKRRSDAVALKKKVERFIGRPLSQLHLDAEHPRQMEVG